MGYTETQETFSGSDCTGTSGGTDRVLTLSNTGLTRKEGLLVYVSGLAVSGDTGYSIDHNSTGTTITFLKRLWDHMEILINYFQADASDDFSNGPLSDFGIEVTRTPVTVTTDFHGNKTYADGTDETIEVVFMNPNQKFNLDKGGLNEVYDAKIFLVATQTINKYDKITHDSKVYRVDTVNTRNFNGTAWFKMATLFYLEDE